MSNRERSGALVGAILTLASIAMPVRAAQVLGVRVTRDDARFLITMRITLEAPPPAVFRALQNYSAMRRYNPDLRAVRVQATAAPDRVRLFTTVHACVLIFCRTMHQEEIMTARPNADGGVLEAVMVAHGDFKEGRGRWTVKACRAIQRTTCLDAQIELVPRFWVPPVIGPWVMRGMMADEARRTSFGLEQIARQTDGTARTARQDVRP